MKFSIQEIAVYERQVRLRMPFRFGIVTLTEAPQAFVRARIRLENGREAEGGAAELLAPKWFDKDPALTNEQNFGQLRASLALAREAYLAAGANTAFGHFIGAYEPQIAARHTVGLVDPITSSAHRVNDGLPETLEEIVDRYGHRWFKLKVGGDAKADVERLGAIAAVLDRIREPYYASLDGNEQYENVQGVLALWGAVKAEPRLKRLASSVVFIEQPIKRQNALAADISALAKEKPVIIDESDDSLEAFPRAKALGYRGVSSKTCKGLYKSLINAARCKAWGERYFMTGEDLTIQAGIALQQDLALVSLLGLTHVERNGHHYVNGMAGLPTHEQENFLGEHQDLYERTHGAVRVRIKGGMIQMKSLDCPGFASRALPDWTAMRAMS